MGCIDLSSRSIDEPKKEILDRVKLIPTPYRRLRGVFYSLKII